MLQTLIFIVYKELNETTDCKHGQFSIYVNLRNLPIFSWNAIISKQDKMYRFRFITYRFTPYI